MLNPEVREKFVPCGMVCVCYAPDICQTCQKCINPVSGRFFGSFQKAARTLG